MTGSTQITYRILGAPMQMTVSTQCSISYICLHVHFSHLEQEYKMVYGAHAKMTYRLSDRVLHPSSVERVNVQLEVIK